MTRRTMTREPVPCPESGAGVPRDVRHEAGAGSVLAIGVIAVALALTLMVVPLGGLLALRRQAAGAADAAALAAADVAVGLAGGSPCPTAASVASADGADLTSCAVDGPVVTVHVMIVSGVVPLTAAATAGPPTTGGSSVDGR